MTNHFVEATAVVTGAASGLGLALCRRLAAWGMKLVMADVQADALEAAADEIRALGAQVLPFRLDVAQGGEVEALALATQARFGAPRLLFNNAGVSAGGSVWENSARDWEWVLGVNLMGVVHGVRVFTPLMLAAATDDPSYRGRIVNTASVAGLVCAPNMGIYNVSKHAVVALSETLHHDLRLVTDQIGVSVVCPHFVRTAIAESGRNRPANLSGSAPMTKSQRINRVMAARAVAGASVSADDVACAALDAIRHERFYVHTHSEAMAGIEARLDDIRQGRNPSDAAALPPQVAGDLRRALRRGSG